MVYEAPQLLTSAGSLAPPPEVAAQVILAMALILVLFGSLAAFCLVTCGGWGHVKECWADGNNFGHVICK